MHIKHKIEKFYHALKRDFRLIFFSIGLVKYTENTEIQDRGL